MSEIGRKLKYVLQSITVEPLLILFLTCTAMVDITRQDLIYQTICTHILPGETRENCSETAEANASIKHEVESATTAYIQHYIIIEAVVPSILSLFIGPWSDQHGRKWPIVRTILYAETIKPRLKLQ